MKYPFFQPVFKNVFRSLFNARPRSGGGGGGSSLTEVAGFRLTGNKNSSGAGSFSNSTDDTGNSSLHDTVTKMATSGGQAGIGVIDLNAHSDASTEYELYVRLRSSGGDSLKWNLSATDGNVSSIDYSSFSTVSSVATAYANNTSSLAIDSPDTNGSAGTYKYLLLSSSWTNGTDNRYLYLGSAPAMGTPDVYIDSIVLKPA